MGREVWPTEDVWLACLRGLDLFERRRQHTDDHGGTEISVSFAQTVRDRFPVDLETCAQVVEAHRTLLLLPGHARQHPRYEVTRLLWGGDKAIDWAQAALDSAFHERRPSPTTPVPLAAAVPDRDLQTALDELADEISRIESETVAALRAAFWVSYRTALRRSGAVATSRVNGRVPVAAQAAAGFEGDDLNRLRAKLEVLHPWDRWPAAAPVLAAIPVELDTTLQGELEDYEETAESILGEMVAALVALVAVKLGVSKARAEELVPSDVLRAGAAKRAANGLLDWVRLRLSGDRDPADLPELSVPEPLFRETIGQAGEVVDPLVGFSVGAVLVERVLTAISGQRIESTVVPVEMELSREWVWRRGAPITPHPDHVDLGGRTWRSDTERVSKVGRNFPGDHWGCQCWIQSRWLIA